MYWITLLGYIAPILIAISFVFYFQGIRRGTTKPHPLSWLIWGLLNAIAFAAQIAGGAGIGAIATGAIALSCTTIGLYSLKKQNVSLSLFDWISFLGGISALIGWQITNNPLTAVLLVTLADIFGFLPTLRKGFYKPYDDMAITFALDSFALLLGIIAIETKTFTTLLYPIAIVLLDTSFVVVLLSQRNKYRA
ncbi:MAG: hypothetical protein WCV86_01735 [Patescibacteria group bacterium]|jgi:hypothetical protein